MKDTNWNNPDNWERTGTHTITWASGKVTKAQLIEMCQIYEQAIVSMAEAAARHHFQHITIKREPLTAEEREFAQEHVDYHLNKVRSK